MTQGFSDDQWRNIYDLALEAIQVPSSDRVSFVQSRSTDEKFVTEVLQLAETLEQPDETPSRLGSAIGRFVLEEYLGAGGAGEVYSARDPELARMVALKLLRSDSPGIQDTQAQERFIREARAASSFNHPNIVTVHEIIRTGGMVAIVMELVEGVPLRQLCGKPVPLPRLVRIGEQIADALATAHNAGLVHRDIKPENVMLMSDDRVKVLDFGLARHIIHGNETTGTLTAGIPAGTISYMSPEHYRSQPITSRSDMFAFGIVMYELATGQHPFIADSPFEVLTAIATQEPKPPSMLNPELPSRLNSMILGLLNKDPAQRLTAANVTNELRQLASPATDRGAGGRKLPRWAWVSLLAGLVITGFGIGAWKFLRPRSEFGNKLEQITTLLNQNKPTAAAISGDGKLLAYANIDGVFLKSLQSDQLNVLNGPEDFAVDHLAWFPDGSALIISGFSEETNQPSIWMLPITGGKARELRKDARMGQPSPDGSRIAFLQDDYSAIWTMASDGEDARRLIAGTSRDSFPFFLWSGNGRHILFQRRHYSGQEDLGYVMFPQYYESSFESASADSGAVSESLAKFALHCAISRADGELFFLGGAKPGINQGGQLWATRVNPTTGRFSGTFRKVETPLDYRHYSFAMSGTQDASKIALIRQTTRESVFVADFNRPALNITNIRELTLDGRASYPHAWTTDSNSIIFESSRSGGYDIFKQRIDQRVPEAVVTTPKRWDVFPQLSPDGRFVLYAAGPASGAAGPYNLMRIPVDGGVIEQIPIGGYLDEFRCSVGRKGRCVIRTTIDQKSFVFSELDPVRGIGKELARTSWLPSILGDWNVSPDGSLVAIPNHDSRTARIRLLKLNSTSKEPPVRELQIPGLANVSSVTWAMDQTGWFVSLETSIGRRIYFYESNGQLHSLGNIRGWAVPSPDGKKLAYLDDVDDSNVWMLGRQ